jgi:hypothetical protein
MKEILIKTQMGSYYNVGCHLELKYETNLKNNRQYFYKHEKGVPSKLLMKSDPLDDNVH